MANRPKTTTSSGAATPRPRAATIARTRPAIADLSYPAALAGTLLVEVPLYSALLPRLAAAPSGGASALSPRRAAVIGVVVNVVSHPLLWFVLTPVGAWVGAETVVALVVAEVVVWLLEAALVRALTPVPGPAALGVAALANLASLAVGLWLWALG